MLRGATCSARAIEGTAVFNMVVSSDSMKNATATSQGNRLLLVAVGACRGDAVIGKAARGRADATIEAPARGRQPMLLWPPRRRQSAERHAMIGA